MSESVVQSYLHGLLRCPIEQLPACVAGEIPAEVQSWLAESAERQRDFDLLMAAARTEPTITEDAWEIGHILEYFGADEDYGWKEVMGCVDSVGLAINNGNAEMEQLGMAILRLLLEAGDCPNNDYAIALYSSPLHFACQLGYLEVAKLLLRYGADPNMEDADDWTPLHSAAANNRLECAELLIKSGALVDAPDLAGWTPLYWAKSNKHEDMVALLEKRGARITVFSEKDWKRYMKTYKPRR